MIHSTIPLQPSPRPSDATLRALTWNVGRLFPHPKIHKIAAQRMFKKKQAGLSAYAHDHHLPHIATVIRRLDPDIVTLQEIGSRIQLENLLDQLDNTYAASISSGAEIYDRFVAILTKKALATNTHAIQTTSGRIALAAHVPDYNLIFVGLHVDAIRYQRRTAQLEEILSWLEHYQNQRIVLAGDFNLDLAVVGPRIRRANLGMYHMITEDCKFTDIALSHGNTTRYLPRRLDYVFSNVDRRHILGSHVFRQQHKGLMDHLPVVVDFRF